MKPMIIVMAVLLITGGVMNTEVNAATQVAQDVNQSGGVGNTTDASNVQMWRKIDVSVFVSFPDSRLRFHHAMTVDQGTTAAGAVATVYGVNHGLVCCDSRDVWAINGVPCRPAQGKWWMVFINGNAQNVSSRTVLRQGDVVEWRYVEQQKHVPTQHVRLEDWVGGLGQ